MAAPQIVGIDSKDIVNTGESFDVRIHATDADSKVGTLVGYVTDSEGNKVQAAVHITISDALTYELDDSDNAGFTIIQDPNDPTLFHVTAP